MRIALSSPAVAHRRTVRGDTAKRRATSPSVNSGRRSRGDNPGVMRLTVTPQDLNADRLKPPSVRRHRAVADHEAGLTDAEKNAAAHALAGAAVAQILLRDESFQEALRTLEPEEFASRYARPARKFEAGPNVIVWGSDGWKVLRLLAERYRDTRQGLDRSGKPVGHHRALICLEASTTGWSYFDSNVTRAARARLAEAETGA